jgi:hypothetical protein
MEIADRLENGVSTEAVLAEYSQKWDCHERTVERLIALAKDRIIGKLRNREAVLDAVRSDIIAQDFDWNLVTSHELEAELCQIAKGGTLSERLVYTKQGPEMIRAKVTIGERLKAIHLLLKMRGKLIPQAITDEMNINQPIIINVADEEDKKLIESI